jgi:hypothetical protein
MHSQPQQKLEMSCRLQDPAVLHPAASRYEAECPRAGPEVVEERQLYCSGFLAIQTAACRFTREEHRLRVFENRVMRRIFRPKRDEVTGEWRKQHNDELHNLYSSLNRMIKSRRM